MDGLNHILCTLGATYTENGNPNHVTLTSKSNNGNLDSRNRHIPVHENLAVGEVYPTYIHTYDGNLSLSPEGELKSAEVTDNTEEPVDSSRNSSNEENKALPPACHTDTEIGNHEIKTANKNKQGVQR